MALCREQTPIKIKIADDADTKISRLWLVASRAYKMAAKPAKKNAAIKTSFQMTATVPMITGTNRKTNNDSVACFIFFEKKKAIEKKESSNRNTWAKCITVGFQDTKSTICQM